MIDYSEKGKIVRFEHLSIIFEGVVSYYSQSLQLYRIEVKKWIGKGYPHLVYWSGKDKLTFLNNDISNFNH